VLGTPPAFILSQDQTLIRIFFPNPVSFQILAFFGSLRFFLLFSFQRTCSPHPLSRLALSRSVRLLYFTIFHLACQPFCEDFVKFFLANHRLHHHLNKRATPNIA
ncbi:hypothetical protein, partial [Anoxynatronum buryatiense]|uniref:hypothetical protein n=1 Tax=Anoxynatronum buryatiense TaxID=489973 RepID=UPI0024B7E43A